MRYMLLLYSAADAGPTPGSDEHAAEMNEWFAFTNELVEAGAMISGEPLHGTETATTVRVRDGGALTTDGPFAETKEVFGGFYLIDAEDLDAALALAAQIPAVRMGGSVEVRPVAGP
jgi:hypothetical protein